MIRTKRRPADLVLGAVLVASLSTHATAGDRVQTVRMPGHVYRPQVAKGADGTIHIVHALHGPENRGELRYIRRTGDAGAFSNPVKVNSTPRCAAGFNMAVDENNRVHVLIRPTAGYSAEKLGRKPKFNDLAYMLYCRLNDEGTAFEEERDLSAQTFAFEGVGAIVPMGGGTVQVYWHGLTAPGPENTRQIFMARSVDHGRTFGPPTAVASDVVGSCACCSMQGTYRDGKLSLVFRNSLQSGSKDSWLLTSVDDGLSFSTRLLDPWPAAGCPGSAFSLSAGPAGVAVAWDTQGHVFCGDETGGHRVEAPSGRLMARAPVVAHNERGDVLFTWTEAATPRDFRNGGTLAWCVYDKDWKQIVEKHTLAGAVARWSMPAIYVDDDDRFVILHDGPAGH